MAMPIEELEHVAALGWRAPEEARLGGWLLRAGAGFTGRANSALAAGDPGLPLTEAVTAAGQWYQARGLPAMIAVPYPAGHPEHSAVDRLLAARGWRVRSGPAVVMTARTTDVASLAPAATGVRVEVDPEPGEDWLAGYHYRGRELPPVARQLLMSAPWQAFASVRQAGQTIAIGRVAAGGGWAGLTAIEVDPGHRRRGLGSAVTATLAAAAAGHGAGSLYLQVETENTAAITLYERAGFTVHHGYHYRVAAA